MIEDAVKKVLNEGHRTADISKEDSYLSTAEITDRIIEFL